MTRILHLSDPHFGTEQQTVMTALMQLDSGWPVEGRRLSAPQTQRKTWSEQQKRRSMAWVRGRHRTLQTRSSASVWGCGRYNSDSVHTVPEPRGYTTLSLSSGDRLQAALSTAGCESSLPDKQ